MNKVYTDEYRRKCFDAWYLNNKPSAEVTHELIPEYAPNKKPGLELLRSWIREEWVFHAQELDVEIQRKADEEVIKKRVKILERHQEQSVKMQTKAMEHLMAEGFDSSASAVQALFRGMEEERKTAGFSDLLEKLETMTNNQVRDTIINLINRATENNQIVEGAEVPELESGEEE